MMVAIMYAWSHDPDFLLLMNLFADSRLILRFEPGKGATRFL